MLNPTFKLFAFGCAIVVFSNDSMAQRGGGGMHGGGRGGGMMSAGGAEGGMGIGGGGCGKMNGMSIGNGRSQSMAGAFGGNVGFGGAGSMNPILANQMMASQMMINQNQAMQGCQRGFGNTNSTMNTVQARPTTAQFVQKAMSFDRNGDGLLNEGELTQVATAVVAELQNRQLRSNGISSNSFLRIKQSASTNSLSAGNATSQMATVFVSKALSYDKDANGTLDAKETKAMASALIKTLG